VVAYPFAATSVSTGESIEEVVWRDVPKGLLPEWTNPVTGTATVVIQAGTPILPSLVADIAIPPGWWAVSLPLPQRVAPGTPVRVALNGDFADGVVAGALNDTGYELTAPVAFPPDQASRVVTLAADSTTVVLIGSLVAGNE
jgi:hypothetical protein